MDTKLTVTILNKNSQATIKKALESVFFADQIVILDDSSTDKSVEIAKKYKTEIISYPVSKNFAEARNSAIQHAQHEWILFVDADEEVSEELALSIKSTLKKPLFNNYSIVRRDIFLGKMLTHGEWGHNTIVRLVKKDTGLFTRMVHEKWVTRSSSATLDGILYHHKPSIAKLVSNIKSHSKMHAQENYSEGKWSSFWKIVFFPVGKFVQNYVYKRGFLDGVHGFVYSALMSFHSFLTWGDLWLLQKKK